MAHPLASQRWQYEIIDRINREILVFYTADNVVKGSVVLDTQTEKDEWKEYMKKIGFNIKE